MSRHVRCYRRLLALYPGAFRAEYADEMARLFADQLRDARRAGGAMPVARLWAATVADLVATASRQHAQKEAPVARPVDGSLAGVAIDPPRRSRGRLVAGLTPLIVYVALSVIAPGFLGPIYDPVVSVVGVPLGVLVAVAAMACMGLGLLALRAWESPGGTAAALLLFTLPATVAVILGPAVVLVLVGLVAVP
jgi:hypothetical protein